MKKPVIVADAGPLIALAKCGQLALLPQVFGQIHLPHAVLREASGDSAMPGALAVSSFVHGFAQVHPNRDDELFRDARMVLDEGEAQALSLARSLKCAVLLDDRRGRLVATELGISLFGVLGTLLQAKRIGIIDAVKPVLDALLLHDYRLSASLVAAVLHEAGE